MRYKIAEQPTILGKFDSGATVTITLYDLSDESTETLTSNSCNEIASTGVFAWSTSNITTQPTTLTEYLWIMTDGTITSYGKIVLGGYPDQTSEDVWTALTTESYGTNTMGEQVKSIPAKIKYIDGGELPIY